MNFNIPLWSKCLPILLLLSAFFMDKLTFVLGLPQENEFLRPTKQSTSPQVSTTSIMETKEVKASDTSRLIRLEEELSRLSHKFSLQDSKNEEYDRAVNFVKELMIKQTESESSQKREIEALKGIVSKVQFKEEIRDEEMKQLKGKVNQIESQISENQQSDILKRQNSTTSKPNNITTRLPCSFKTPCVYDFKNPLPVNAASTSSLFFYNISKSNNFTTSKSNITARLSCTPTIPCAFDFKDASVSAASRDKINASTSSPELIKFFELNKFTTKKPARLPSTNNNYSSGRVDYTDASIRAASSDKEDSTSSLPALKNISKSIKPPSSCKELSTNGHTLNGIYLLYDSIFNKVLTTFCDFSSNIGAHQQLGFVNVKSLPEGVYFYAQRLGPFFEHNVIIPFDQVLINEGGGLNGSTGIFTAPKTGVYRFWFNCQKTGTEAPLHIDLRVNGANVANAYGHNIWSPASFHSVVKLKTGDEVYLFLFGDGEIYDDSTPDTHFSGWLVDEELIFSQK